jgi:hypothetical protein
MKLVIEESDIIDLKAVANDCLGLILTYEQARAVFYYNNDYAAQCFQYGIQDTEVRSKLANLFSMKLLGKPWPTYGDRIDMKEWDAEFKEKAVKAGFEVRA